MLRAEEKAYCRGLAALRKSRYIEANREFELCRNYFADNKRMNIIFEATRVLAMLENGREREDKKEITIEEID